MTRSWILTAVLTALLANTASASVKLGGVPHDPAATLVVSPTPARPESPEDVDRAPFVRLGRGIAVDHLTRLPVRTTRPAREWDRSPWSPSDLIDAPASGVGMLPLAPDRAPAFARSDAAQRDGTCSFRSTGLPPPSV